MNQASLKHSLFEVKPPISNLFLIYFYLNSLFEQSLSYTRRGGGKIVEFIRKGFYLLSIYRLILFLRARISIETVDSFVCNSIHRPLSTLSSSTKFDTFNKGYFYWKHPVNFNSSPLPILLNFQLWSTKKKKKRLWKIYKGKQSYKGIKFVQYFFLFIFTRNINVFYIYIYTYVSSPSLLSTVLFPFFELINKSITCFIRR